MHRHAVEYSTYPRGPRSGPGYSVPVRHHLFGPIRPTRRYIAISPHAGLYAMPSLCGSAEATRERFRAFAAHSFLACRPLRPRGVRHRYVPDLRCRHGLRHPTTGSALPTLPQSAPRGSSISWLHWFACATACQVARPPTRIGLGRPSPRGLLLPGFQTDWSPSPLLVITTTVAGSPSVGGTLTRWNGS